MLVQETARRILKTIDPDDDFQNEIFRLVASDSMHDDWDELSGHCAVLERIFVRTLSREQRALYKALQDVIEQRDIYGDAYAASLTMERLEELEGR